MHDDILYRLRTSFKMPNLILSDDQLKNYVLYELEQLFNDAATTLQDHKLPMPNGQLLIEIRNMLLREELNYDLADLKSQHSLNLPLLNNRQKIIYDSVVAAVLQKKQSLIFVHGHGGTGKTFFMAYNHQSDQILGLSCPCCGLIRYCISFIARRSYSPFKIQNPTYC